MALNIRQLAGGHYIVDDGAGAPLAECPCCGKALTEAAALEIAKKIDEGELTIGVLRDLAALRTAGLAEGGGS